MAGLHQSGSKDEDEDEDEDEDGLVSVGDRGTWGSPREYDIIVSETTIPSLSLARLWEGFIRKRFPYLVASSMKEQMAEIELEAARETASGRGASLGTTRLTWIM